MRPALSTNAFAHTFFTPCNITFEPLAVELFDVLVVDAVDERQAIKIRIN